MDLIHEKEERNYTYHLLPSLLQQISIVVTIQSLLEKNQEKLIKTNQWNHAQEVKKQGHTQKEGHHTL